MSSPTPSFSPELAKLRGMSILITGGCGFIGSHCVEVCHALGMDVYVFDNMASGHTVLSPTSSKSASITYIYGDICNGVAFRNLPSHIDFVIHLAAAISVVESMTNPAKYHAVNVEGSNNVFEYAIGAGAKAVVSASSAAFYGDCGTEAITETYPYQGISPYADSKMTMECLGEACNQRQSQTRFFFCRFFNVYGPRQDPSSPYTGVISIFMECCRSKKPITIFGDGQQTRDFIFVRDVVAGCLSILSGASALKLSENAFNVGTGKSVTINRLAELVIAASGVKPEETPIMHCERRAGDIRDSLSCCNRLKTSCSWNPSVELGNGLKTTWNWFTNQADGLMGDLTQVDHEKLRSQGILIFNVDECLLKEMRISPTTATIQQVSAIGSATHA
ncbi:UDP-glucose 4-epimerase [Giardia muris]|uniref:UDP-glucose 4-epimerase n=1 Tax=Giardia muris TaxID=5742 RepID=A0A4Z1SUW2_GIAMU|nr:UDP-glucose 4-epimerase [Giardia muris]|eukprot:TNJ28735.1 UDP-glucose 4-epimerase [Giardia muris]